MLAATERDELWLSNASTERAQGAPISRFSFKPADRPVKQIDD
jgi:hypothetical protein